MPARKMPRARPIDRLAEEREAMHPLLAREPVADRRWVMRVPPDPYQRQGHLDEELGRLERYPLLICDEVGYIPFDPHAANLMFMLIRRSFVRLLSVLHRISTVTVVCHLC